MDNKKVSVTSVDTRKFVEGILYLGSLGGKITKNCVAIKGMMIRAEVELPWDVPVEESQTIRVSKQAKVEKLEAQVEVKEEIKQEANKPKPKAKPKAQEQPETEESE